jgi:hypothetical protein
MCRAKLIEKAALLNAGDAVREKTAATDAWIEALPIRRHRGRAIIEAATSP